MPKHLAKIVWGGLFLLLAACTALIEREQEPSGGPLSLTVPRQAPCYEYRGGDVTDTVEVECAE